MLKNYKFCPLPMLRTVLKPCSHYKMIEKLYPPSAGSPTVVKLTCEEEMEHLQVWESDKGSNPTGNDNDKPPANLVSLYLPPFNLMFQGSFEKAKHAAYIQHKWLLVNLQSLKEFISHMLNRDTWHGLMKLFLKSLFLVLFSGRSMMIQL